MPGLPWTADEEQRLREMVSTGESIDRIAAALGRPKDGIMQKVRRLDLRVVVGQSSAGTTTSTVELPPELPTPEEALKIPAGALKAGAQSGLSKVEVQRLTALANLNTTADNFRKNFYKQRRRIATMLQNRRLKQIRLHTLRHWKATMEYHRTNNIKWVQRLLGHKKVDSTDLYTRLISFENDEWHVAHAKDLQEESKLIEAGFELVRYSDRDQVAIYRKRK